MKKKLLFLALLLCVATLCFAERRTRVDTYRNYTIKWVWDDNHSSAPSDINYAKEWYNDSKASWKSVREYLYLLNKKHGMGDRASVKLYDSGVGPYKVLNANFKDGLWEKVYEEDFYNYNRAYSSFSMSEALFETLIE